MPARIPTDELINDLRRVATKVEGVPSYDDYRDHGDYSLRPIKDRFGGIVSAREAAGIGEGAIHGIEVNRDDLLSDLRRVSDKLGRPPSWNEYDEHGKYSAKSIYNEFGGMEEARNVAGLGQGPTRPERIGTDELIREFQRVGEVVGHSPTESDVEEIGEYALRTYIRRFGSWSAAAERAGYDPNPMTPEGEDNPAWKGGNSHNYSSKQWRKQREEALERDDYECQACGMTNDEHLNEFGRELDVHHIEPLRTFNDPVDSHDLDNLITLCRPHHREYESLPAQRAKELRNG